jgi:protease PrsW
MGSSVHDKLVLRERAGLAIWVVAMLGGGFLLFAMYLIAPMFRDNTGSIYLAMMIGAAISFPCCLAYMIVPVVVDRYDPEPWWLLAMSGLWGAIFACGVATTTITILDKMLRAIGGNAAVEVLSSTMMGPGIEEALKGAFVVGMLLFGRRYFDGVVDGVIYAIFAGLGFAAMENVLYFGQQVKGTGISFAGMAQTFWMRGVMTPWTHPFFTAMTGLGVGISRESTSTPIRIGAPVAGFFVAWTLHS